MQPAIRQVSVIALILMTTGCRLGVSVFEGGDVISASEERHCFEGGTCEFSVDSPLFSETFTAKPRFGYEFVKWRAGELFLCAGSADPVCTVTLDGDNLSRAVVSTGHMGYLMPEFACTGICPERPNHTWNLIDDAIDAMAEARDAISAYVASNGEGAPDPSLYGVYVGTRNALFLRDIEILPNNATLSAGTAHTFYVIANMWGLLPPPGAYTTSFALSGQTNSDNTMHWECIPSHPDDTYIPNGPDAVPEQFLPFECRG